MIFVRQSLIILLSIGFMIFLKSIFPNLPLFLLGVGIVLYLIFSNRKRIDNFNFFVLINAILVLILSTGEIASPLFFLVYLLSFVFAFVFEPKVVFVFILGLIILFFPSALKDNLNQNLAMLFSLFLLSPVAFFLGKDYQEKQEKKKRFDNMKAKAQQIETEIEAVLSDSRRKLNPQAAIKLSEELEESF